MTTAATNLKFLPAQVVKENPNVHVPGILDRRVALFTHALSPHRLALVEAVAAGVAVFRVYLSEAEDRLHKFPAQHGKLHVTLQKSLNWVHSFQNIHGYADVSDIHVPFDTLSKLLRFKPDIVISTELGIRSLLATAYRLCCPAVSVVLWATLSARTEATRGIFRRTLRRWLLTNADCVFVNGVDGERYIRALGYNSAIHLIPYAIDDTLFLTQSYNPQRNTFRLLYTGQLIPRKGLRAFCAGLNVWCDDHPKSQITLTLVGEGSERCALAAIKTVSNLCISIHDHTSQEGLLRFYEEADLSVLPTLGDEWGVAVNESLSAGRPVLGSVHSQAVTELIHDGINGWTWNPEQDRSLYAALSRAFATCPEDLKSMSAASKRSVKSVNPQDIASRVLEAFSTLATRN